MSQPHAVIIAGGRGERLGGVRKADLRLGGDRLVDRVADALGAVQAPLMIAVGPTDDGRGAREGSLAVTDLVGETAGPLAGLGAALASLHARGITAGLLVSASVDTPFLPQDMVGRLMDALGDSNAAFAAWEDQFYPPNALWRLEALASLPGQIAAGEAPKSLKALLHGLGAQRVDWAGSVDSNPFRNVNVLADLLELGRNARK